MNPTRECLMNQKLHPDKDKEGWTSPVQGSDPEKTVQVTHPQLEILGLKWDAAPHRNKGAGIPLVQLRCSQVVLQCCIHTLFKQNYKQINSKCLLDSFTLSSLQISLHFAE